MTLIKRNKIWHYQTKVQGKTVRRTTGQSDRRSAEKVAKQIASEIQLLKKPHKNSQKLSQAMNREVQRIETDISKGQANRALSSFSAFLKWLGHDPGVGAITFDIVESFQRDRLKRYSMETVHKDLTLLLRLLRNNGIHIPKPSAKPGKRTIVRPFTPQELAAIFQHVSEANRPLYATLLATGARPAELVPSPYSTHKPLLKTEVDFDTGLIHLRQAKGSPTKPAHPRPPVPVPKEILALLRWQITKTAKKYPFIFTETTKLAYDFNQTLKQAGIDKHDAAGRKLVLHSFRHTYATLMAGQVQNNPHFLKAILGHAKITTTDRYCQVTAPVIAIPDISFVTAPKAHDKASDPKDNQANCQVVEVEPTSATA